MYRIRSFNHSFWLISIETFSILTRALFDLFVIKTLIIAVPVYQLIRTVAPLTIMATTETTTIVVSDLFDVRQTQWGGRACFASKDIPENTTVLQTESAFGATVLYEFRKEVCAYCFHYEYGKYCKFKVPTPENGVKLTRKFQGAGLWFCSQECLDRWTQFDPNNELTLTYESMLQNFQMKLKECHEKEDNNVEISKEIIGKEWVSISEWDDKISKMKKTKRPNQLPVLNEEEYASARFVALVLYNLHTHHKSSELFEHLQSNELEKISRFPVLLKSQTLVYKFLRLSLPEYLQPLLTIGSLRLIFGREYGNAFGIRQITDESSSEEKEFLGYMLSPEASYFNHSCRPNLKKARDGNMMTFTTIKDVEKGEQLCIDYFQISEEPFEYRQKTLNENWFFQCACDRCCEERAMDSA